ncbi:MAG: PAS domain S-box protein [Bdellovibrionaceae bacterium]|nr:PAS domain S-box protein [Pseudobdellovibrionaceae bacterium]
MNFLPSGIDYQIEMVRVNEYVASMSLFLGDLEKVRAALDKTAIVAITDEKGVIIHVNEKFCEISKYTKDELIGNTHRVVNSGYHPPEFFRDMWTTIKQGNVWTGDIRNRAKDGSIYWVQSTIVPFRDQTGRVKEYISIRYDITDKKESESNLRNLIEAAFEGLIIFDLSGRVRWTNALAAQLLGHTEAGIKGCVRAGAF